jgi:CreA protein
MWVVSARRSICFRRMTRCASATSMTPKVPGVTCFISQARKGGWGQPLGLNEDPSNFSVACRQMGPIAIDISTLPKSEEAFSEKTSIFFKATRIYRLPDEKRNTLVYLAVSSKIVNGSPENAISVVPIVPWPSSP